MKLVLVDDNGGFRRGLAAILRTIEGIEITGEAKDVPGAIAVIRQTKPDAIILDLHMPGGSGLDVLRFAKSRTPSPVVVVLTVGPKSIYQSRSLAAGADYFFEKSSELLKMTRVLRNLTKFPAENSANLRSA